MAIRASGEALLIDYSADSDHNRCVMTILGGGEPIRLAVLAAAQTAVEHIDLRAHTGVHPRTGAIDVVPVVPLRNATRAGAIALADQIGRDLVKSLELPVYFYESNSKPQQGTTGSALPDLRRGGFERFAREPLIGTLAPSLGPSKAHPSAGIVIVGAREPLVAYNINLNTPDISTALQIARRIRQERDRLPALAGVRALGLVLQSQNRAQVSLNLTRPAETPLSGVYAFVQQEAMRLGITSELESEIIGVIPRSALGNLPPEAIHWHTYKPTQILEYWLENSSPLSGAELLAGEGFGIDF